MTKRTGPKIATALKPQHQGKLRWVLGFANGDTMDKYNDDGTKNVYATKVNGTVKVHVPIDQVSSIGLTDDQGNVLAVMDVPAGAKVFQRRRVRDIPYSGTFVTASKTVGGKLIGNRWYPKRTLTKQVPVYEYGQCWLIGWRTADALEYKVVFEDGRVDTYTEWNTTPWTYEPEWFPDEHV